ncbi:leucine--tRNA ligase [Methanothrix soehngenii]|uniref:leucine--tRNA ligase n=1 Tax=Methanothrix soehngenii TaxID=2223 RepID=UPI002FE3BB43
MLESYSAKEVEAKWQRIWEENAVYEPEPDERQKFLLTIPYPYLNGNLHAGHTRTFTIGDAYARYKRMRGYNVLFPMGFHATGTPIVGLSELIANKDPLIWGVYTRLHGIPEEELASLNTPEKIVLYFRRQAKAAMQSIGYSIDWRREFTTTDPAYSKFIEWQYGILRNLDYVVKGSHPVRWCPHDKNPVEDHDILKGEDATIMDFALIKFKMGDTIMPCATLRPETVFGVTNLWLNPSVTYVMARINHESWIVSKEAYEKLTYTDRTVAWEGEIPGIELIGKRVTNPLTGAGVLVLPAGFVDPDNGSGIVMSVPAHAPYDYLALKDLYEEDLSQYGIKEDLRAIEFISLIESPGYGEFPAVEAVKELGVRDQNDPKAEDATKMVYRREFHNGVLKPNTGCYAGVAVSKIKDLLLRDLIDRGIAEIFYEFSEAPVICRCGTRCVIMMVRDQWFLEYSNPEWKGRVLWCLSRMKIVPPEFRVEFENKIDWLKDKACARRKGLGTHLPWDKEWLIESLGDSTIYMAYYILAKYVNAGMKIDNLPPEFFEYIFMDNGDAAAVADLTGLPGQTVQQIHDDFAYWYPVDLRTSGKDLVANHLLFFLYHHVAIFPEQLWPKAIAVNGFVSLEGQKMSKSKGPLLTLRQAVAENGADVTRLYILGNAEGTADVDWRNDGVEATHAHLDRFYNLAREIMADGSIDESAEKSLIDRWMLSRLQRRISEATEAMEEIQTRRALQSAFYLLMGDLRWYQRRGGKNQLRAVLSAWVRMMSPFIPHICEELWAAGLGQGYASRAEWPVADESLIDVRAEKAEDLLERTLNDVQEIVNVTKAQPSRIALYTTPQWKKEMLRLAVAAAAGGKLDMGALMKEAMANPAIAEHKKDAPKYAQKLAKAAHSLSAEALGLDEYETLTREKEYLASALGAPVEIFSAEEPGADPKGKSKQAEPGRPAIYIE